MSSSARILLFGFACALAARSAGGEGRPTLGVALGGGAARGIAHIGFLQWLEDHHVPVDYVAGTSMGGLIGGAFASGMSSSELRRLMEETDWQAMFLADSPFRYKTFRRKEDAREFPAQLDFGLAGGLKFPSGFNPGQAVQLMLDRIAAPYSDIASFDELPTPLRLVATDLRASEVVVLGSGSLALAMRATMAIPGLFTPVELDERLFVDGGTLNNVPADVVAAMGADVAIAVNVGTATDEPTAPANLFDVLGQTMDVMMSSGVARALQSADLVVTPDLRGLGSLDWSRSEELFERGYQAAEAVREELLPYRVDPAVYDSWRRARESRRRSELPVIREIRVGGIPDEPAAAIRARLERRVAGRKLDPEEVRDEILLLAGTDRYSLIRYTVQETETGGRLVLLVTPKRHGPPFLLPAMDLQNIDSNTFAMNLRGRVVSYDTLVPDSEIRFDFAVGTRQSAGIELYRRLFETRIFLAPRGYVNRESLNGYDDQGGFLAEYREKSAGAGLDLGIDLGTKNEIRLGYDVAEVRTRLRIGEPSLPEAFGRNRFASIRWTFDGQTSPIIPSRGWYSRLSLRRYDTSPDLSIAGERIEGARDYAQGEARVSYFRPLRERHRLFLGASGGTSFGGDPGYNEFRLGGLLRLGAFNNGEVFGRNYFLGLGGLLYQVVRLPEVLGGSGYVGGWLEAGSAFEEWATAKAQWNASAGFVLETILGPFFAGGTVSLTNGDHRFYVSLGPFVR